MDTAHKQSKNLQSFSDMQGFLATYFMNFLWEGHLRTLPVCYLQNRAPVCPKLLTVAGSARWTVGYRGSNVWQRRSGIQLHTC